MVKFVSMGDVKTLSMATGVYATQDIWLIQQGGNAEVWLGIILLHVLVFFIHYY